MKKKGDKLREESGGGEWRRREDEVKELGGAEGSRGASQGCVVVIRAKRLSLTQAENLGKM